MNFLDLVNDVNNEVNEVPLTSSNFSSAKGFYSLAKRAVNNSIRKINTVTTNWPWNHITKTILTVAGTARYDYPSDAKTLDFNTFRIKRTTDTPTYPLINIIYEEYVQRNFIDDEYSLNSSLYGSSVYGSSFYSSFAGVSVPRYVSRTPDRQFVLYPIPDKVYEVIYEYYSVPTDLSAYDDTPTIPAQFRTAILEGAMYYVNLFRRDPQEAQLREELFKDQIKDMRRIYINRYPYVRSTRILRPYQMGNYIRTS